MAAEGTVIIGVGSPVMGDDGLGLHLLGRLEREWAIEGVRYVDGGTWGMSLLPDIEGAARLLFLDAINSQRHAPGTVLSLDREAIPKVTDHNKLSPHQVDLREVLAVCEFRGTLPDETWAIGAVPEVVDIAVELSAPVAASSDACIAAIIDRLRVWGHDCVPRTPETAHA